MKVGGCCNPFVRASHCVLVACGCDLHHHAAQPPARCDRIEGSHADGVLGHEFAEVSTGVPV